MLEHGTVGICPLWCTTDRLRVQLVHPDLKVEHVGLVPVEGSALNILDRWVLSMQAAGLSPKAISERLSLVRRFAAIAAMAPEAWSTEPLTQFLACSSSMAGGICHATISDAMERLGIPGICHDPRRRYASNMIANGESLTTLQQLLGHSLVTTRQHYITVSDGHRFGALLAPASSLVECT